MDKIKKRIDELNQELLDLRRDFHRYPELGFEEHRTAGIVENYLKNLGLHTERMTKTGIVGLLEGSKRQPVLLLRADMDALPVEEENDVDYKSKNKGIMHACGHDAHMAILLGVAKILQKHGPLDHQVNFIFQPAEESDTSGAIRMIEEGALKNVDAIAALHVDPQLDVGCIGIRRGVMNAACDTFITKFPLVLVDNPLKKSPEKL